MKTIEIDETILALVPKEFLNLPAECNYRLTKIEDHREFSMVFRGDSVTGSLSIVNVKSLNLPGVRVQGDRMWNYIRTSPIVKVLDSDEKSITFQTEGGVYRLDTL